MPIPSRNLGRCFAGDTPDAPALVDLRDWERPLALSYASFDAECNAVARGLVAAGLTRGQRVGILALNRYEVLAAFFGCMRAGLVAVPISFKLAPDAVKFIVRDAELAAVLHDHERRHLCPADVLRVDFDEPSGYGALRDPGPFPATEPAPREVGMMLYTSGSTGRAKGVLLSHDSQRWALEQALGSGARGARHRYLIAAPIFHMNATFSVQAALASGASLVLMPAFEARTYAQAIERFRVTWLTSVPTMLALVSRESALLGGLDLSSVERVTMGSAPLTEALVERVQAIFPNAMVHNGYGTTEGGPTPFGEHPGGLSGAPTALGYPLPGSEVELREGTSADEGVLYMRSPMLMNGYHNLPEQTAEALRGGWYRSGDIMRRDADGFFYFVGRADDMFVVGGENVWPAEVERLLERMPGVHQALVVPVPDEIKGSLPFAFVVPQPGAAVDEAGVKAFALGHGPAYAHPRFVELVSEVPLAATNKPDRRRLAVEAARLAPQRRAAAARLD